MASSEGASTANLGGLFLAVASARSAVRLRSVEGCLCNIHADRPQGIAVKEGHPMVRPLTKIFALGQESHISCWS